MVCYAVQTLQYAGVILLASNIRYFIFAHNAKNPAEAGFLIELDG
ncbi:hypothetical protein PPRY_a2778 [Pseudoalteromonas prydzensis ACAM 620]|nr:hypothetical protein [Pseudoalteromonas prydzensis ACAM 620]